MDAADRTDDERGMFPEQSAALQASVDKLERLGQRIESALTRKPWMSVLLLSSVFVGCASMKARRGMFWFDEVLTFYISSLPSFSAIWKALMGHAESGSPISHMVAKLSADIFGWTPFGLRVPANICILVMPVVGLRSTSRVEHKAEHNNCRMRAPEPNLEALSPTVSS